MNNKPLNITTFRPDEFVNASSKFLNELILELLEERKIINIALSGGNSPLPIYSKLSSLNIDWNRIQFFMVDERCVTTDSKESNYGNIKKCFLSKIPSNSYAMVKDGVNFFEAAKKYQQTITSKVDMVEGFPQFDLIILGMGLDGHTASLFPETKALTNTQDLVVLNHIPQLQTNRITMTYPLILNAKRIVLIANGEAKKKVLENLFEKKHPIAKIIPQIYSILN